MDNKNRFGEYLKQLIHEAGLTQTDFYTRLGIKKPYFYDIVAGRVSPPPPDIQFKALDILNANADERETFFDLAAKGRGTIPADIARWIANNPDAKYQIRREMIR